MTNYSQLASDILQETRSWRQRRKLLGVLQIVFNTAVTAHFTPHVSSRLDPTTSSWIMLQVASVENTSVLTILSFQRLFCLVLLNFATAERLRDGDDRLTKSHGTRTRSRDSSGTWGAWSSKRDSRGISEEEVILQELKELILDEEIGEVRRHKNIRGGGSFHRGEEERKRGGRQLDGQVGTAGAKFERQVGT